MTITARAGVVAEQRNGSTQLATVRSQPPLTVRQTGPDQIHLVGTAAGPLGGDELALDIDVRSACSLRVGSVAASLVQPGAVEAPSSLTVTMRVGSQASLHWRPEPTVLVRGCDHHVTTVIELADDACLLWCDIVALGRWNEESGSLLQRLRIDVGGRPLARTDLAVGPRWPHSLGPAVLAGASAVATLVCVEVTRRQLPSIDEPDLRAEVFELSDRATMWSAIATNARVLHDLCIELSAETHMSRARDQPGRS